MVVFWKNSFPLSANKSKSGLWFVSWNFNLGASFDIVILPLAVVTPAMLTLSKFVWPSTSKSPFASIAPVNVDTPETANPVVVVVPLTLTPELVVSNLKSLS